MDLDIQEMSDFLRPISLQTKWTAFCFSHPARRAFVSCFWV